MENSEKSGQPGKQPVGRPADDLRQPDSAAGARDESTLEKMQENASATRTEEQTEVSGSEEQDRNDKNFGLGDTSQIENGA